MNREEAMSDKNDQHGDVQQERAAERRLLVETLMVPVPVRPRNWAYDPIRQVNVVLGDSESTLAISLPESEAHMKTKTAGGGSSED